MQSIAVLSALALVVCVHVAFAGPQLQAPDSNPGTSGRGGIGVPISEWYLSLKTNVRGLDYYCGLVPAAGGYGLAISCVNRSPQYDSLFALLVSDDGGATAAAASAASSNVARGAGAGRGGLADASSPVVVPSGQPVRLLARAVGLCNTPPAAPPPMAPPPAAPPPTRGLSETRTGWHVSESPGSTSAAELEGPAGPPAAAAHGKCRASWVLRAAMVLYSWVNTWRCGAARALCPVQHFVADCGCGGGGSSGGGSGTDGGSGCSKAAAWCGWLRGGCCRRRVAEGCSGGWSGGWSGDGAENAAASASASTQADLPPRAVICALGQPSALSYKIFKSDLKDGESVDLNKEWIYLVEGDKYCTLADVSGLHSVISCHLDAPGWSAYKFQLQTLSYPRSQLVSLLTETPCGVRQPSLPGPHDVECLPGEQAGRAPEVDVVLQTPGSALTAGVVVGFSTFPAGLLGSEQQRCCALAASPHIILCEPPPAGAVSNDCWFKLLDVKIDSGVRQGQPQEDAQLDPARGPSAVAAAAGEAQDGRIAAGAADPRVSEVVGGATHNARFGAFLLSFLRAMAAEMSPSGLDPELGPQPDPDPDTDRGSEPDPNVEPKPGPWGTAASSPTHRRPHTGLGQRSPLPWIELEPLSAAAAEAGRRRRQAEAGPGDGLVTQRQGHGQGQGEGQGQGQGQGEVQEQGQGLQSSADWDPDSRPDPQPPLHLLKGSPPRKPGSEGVGGGVGAGTADVAVSDTAPLARRTAAWHWAWVWYSWATRAGAAGALGGAAAPLGNGSLVMLQSSSYGRYCSVSLEGTLLCVSAQASNASRNLFTLVMPPMAQTAGANHAPGASDTRGVDDG